MLAPDARHSLAGTNVAMKRADRQRAPAPPGAVVCRGAEGWDDSLDAIDDILRAYRVVTAAPIGANSTQVGPGVKAMGTPLASV